MGASKRQPFILSGLSVEELRELNRKAKEALALVESKLEKLTCQVVHQGNAVITFTYDGQTSITNSRGQIQIGGDLIVNGKPVKKPVFDQKKISALQKVIPLLKHVRMATGLEIGFIQGDFEPADLGYVLVPAKDVEAERKKIQQFAEVCDKLVRV